MCVAWVWWWVRSDRTPVAASAPKSQNGGRPMELGSSARTWTPAILVWAAALVGVIKGHPQLGRHDILLVYIYTISVAGRWVGIRHLLL